MMELFMYSIVCFSLTFGLLESQHTVIVGLRKLIGDKISEKLIQCYHCCGFWMGIFVSPIVLDHDDFNIFGIFFMALYAGGIVYLIHIVEDYLFVLTNKIKMRK